MLGPEKMQKLGRRLLSLSKAEQTEVVVLGKDAQLTRFANSHIHQNVAESNVQVRVRAVVGKSTGVASTNDLSDAALERVTDQAVESALLLPEDPDFQSLPGPQPIACAVPFVQATADYNPNQRARAVGIVCRLAEESGLAASGAFAVSCDEVLVSSTLGVLAYAQSTMSELTTVVMSDDSSGYGNSVSADVRDINPESIAREAVDKALRSRNPRSIDPGEYTVVLEEYATAEILQYLSYLGFGALAAQEGRSFMTGKLGQQITGGEISIWDDGLDAAGLPMPFDFEGVPKQRVDLISRGVASGVVYDSYTANREGKSSTGHALPAPNSAGPFASNLFMQCGSSSKEQMVASIDRGLWITRFHYVNPVHPLKAVLTGMTRDGTFWIEGGEVRGAVKNLRFTQAILEAFSRTRSVGRDTKLARGFIGGIHAPAICLEGFVFTGATQF